MKLCSTQNAPVERWVGKPGLEPSVAGALISEVMSPEHFEYFRLGFVSGVVLVWLVHLLRKWTRRG